MNTPTVRRLWIVPMGILAVGLSVVAFLVVRDGTSATLSVPDASLGTDNTSSSNKPLSIGANGTEVARTRLSSEPLAEPRLDSDGQKAMTGDAPSVQLPLDEALKQFNSAPTPLHAYMLSNECLATILDARNDYERTTPGKQVALTLPKDVDGFVIVRQRQYWIRYDEFPVLKRVSELMRASTQSGSDTNSSAEGAATLTSEDIASLNGLVQQARATIGIPYNPQQPIKTEK